MRRGIDSERLPGSVAFQLGLQIMQAQSEHFSHPGQHDQIEDPTHQRLAIKTEGENEAQPIPFAARFLKTIPRLEHQPGWLHPKRELELLIGSGDVLQGLVNRGVADHTHMMLTRPQRLVAVHLQGADAFELLKLVF